MISDFLRETIKYLSEMTDAPEGALCISEIIDPESTYTRKLFSWQSAYIHVMLKDEPLLRQIADSVTEKLAQIEPYSVEPWFFRSDGTPLSCEELAEEIYLSTYQHFTSHYERVAGLDLHLIELVSRENYESDAASGILAFLPHLAPSEEKVLKKALQVRLNRCKNGEKCDGCVSYERCETRDRFLFQRKNIRQIRKLLAGAGDNALLLQRDGGDYYCCGYFPKEWITEFPYYVVIRAPSQWMMFENNNALFRICYEEPKIAQPPLEGAIRILENELDAKYIGRLSGAIKAISAQHHGTSVVLLELDQDRIAHEKMEKLVAHKRALPVSQMNIMDLKAGSKEGKTLTALSRMDGALVVDIQTGDLRYIASILDGIAIVDSELAFGARHASLKTFLANLVEANPRLQGAALIFSEDGGILTIVASQLRKSKGK